MDFFTDHSLSERKRFVLRSLRAKETHQTLNFKTTTSEGKTKHKKRTIRHGKRFKNNFQTKILASDFWFYVPKFWEQSWTVLTSQCQGQRFIINFFTRSFAFRFAGNFSSLVSCRCVELNFFQFGFKSDAIEEVKTKWNSYDLQKAKIFWECFYFFFSTNCLLWKKSSWRWWVAS